jgi:cobalt-zinc-cadmium efflux system membrane fusion protein
MSEEPREPWLSHIASALFQNGKKVHSRRRAMSAALLVGLALVLGWGWLRRPAEAPAPVAAPAKPANSYQPTPAQWDALKIDAVAVSAFDAIVTADGSIAVNDNATANVFSQYSGRVTSIYGQPGQVVHKGARLLELVATEAAQVKSDVAAAVAAQATAAKQLELARLTERRQHELFLAEAGAQKDWLQSKVDLVAAESADEASRAALLAAREKAAVLASTATGGSHPGDSTLITAPIDGIILQRQVAPGQFVNSLASGGSTPLYTISDLRSVWVVANVSEVDAARIKPGLPVEITALALPGRTLRSRVAWVAATVDPTNHRVAVRAELPNTERALMPQMNVSMRLLDAHPMQAVAVPRAAVVYDGQAAHCYVATAQRTLVARKLELGRMQGDMVEVKSGLSAGERVVTRGALFIDRAAEGDG